MLIGGEQEINMGKCFLSVYGGWWGLSAEEKRVTCNSHGRRLVLLASHK